MTILGRHTVTETRQLLAVADYRFRETFKAFEALSEKPDYLSKQVGELARKWRDNRIEIIAKLVATVAAGFPVPPALLPAESEYNQVLAFVQYGENTIGSLQDITKKVEILSGKPIEYKNQPSQESTDFDVEIYKDLDSAIRQGEVAASKAAKKAAETADDLATSKWPLIIGATAIVSVVGWNVLKSKV